jgi:hypothetical protein
MIISQEKSKKNPEKSQVKKNSTLFSRKERELGKV